MRRAILRTAALVATAAALAATPSRSQSSRFLTGLGYSIPGGAVGLAATANATCTGPGFICIPGEMVVATLGGAILGMTIGSKLSSTANRAVGEGRPVGGAHLTALSVGTVLGGATLGLIASAVMINGDGAGTLLGSDEQTARLFALAGATFGVLHLRRNWGRLTGTSVELQPTVFRSGQPGVVARLLF